MAINETVNEWKDRFLSENRSIVDEIEIVNKLISKESEIINLNNIVSSNNTHSIAINNLNEYKTWLEEYLKYM